MSDNEELKREIKKQKIVSNRTATMLSPFQIDTTNVSKNGGFVRGRNLVVMYYKEGKDNKHFLTGNTIAHEEKHRNNAHKGLKSMPMSLEEYHKVCCHDEISANICGLLQVREEYMLAKTEEEREKIIKNIPRFSFYFDAIKEGKINPFSTKVEDFDEEMAFIAQEVKKYWENGPYKRCYKEQFVGFCNRYMQQHEFSELQSNPENYEKAVKIAYRIGGIDFSKYMDDISVTDSRITKAQKEVMENNFSAAEKTLKTQEDVVPITLSPNPNLSIKQQYMLAEHQLLMVNFLHQNPEIAKMSDQELAMNGAEICERMCDFLGKLDEDPKFRKKWDKELKKISAEIVRQNETVVFLSSDNEEEYQKRLSEIYSYKGISFRKIYGENMDEDIAELSSDNLPENIEHMADNCPWYVRTRNKLRSWVGLDKEKRQTSPKEAVSSKPKYYRHTNEKRVSKVQHRKICDFSRDFLLQRRADIRLQQANDAIELAAIQKAQEVIRNVPDEQYGRKSNPDLKTPLILSGGRE